MMNRTQRDYERYIKYFVMDPAYAKYLYENGLTKEAQRVEKLASREEKKLREKRIDENVKKMMASISEILCEHLRKAQEELECALEKEKEKVSGKEEEIRAKEIQDKSVNIEYCYNPNLFPRFDDFIINKGVDNIPTEEACKKTNVEVLTKEQFNASNELKEKNIGKSWHTTTLVPSSKLACVVKCWDSFNIIQFPNISSLCHEENKVNERDYSFGVENNSEFGKTNYVQETEDEVGRSKPTNGLGNFPIVKVACDGFFRLTFDPGGIEARNLRSNSLEEGENDEDLYGLAIQFLLKILIFLNNTPTIFPCLFFSLNILLLLHFFLYISFFLFIIP